MKTVTMIKDYDYRPKAGVIIAYREGRTYERVPEAAARAIRSEKAGTIHNGDKAGGPGTAPRKDEIAAVGGSIGD